MSRLLGQANIVCLQETHGSDSDIRDSLSHECKHFSFFPSFCANSDSGGVITIVRSSLLLGSTVSSSSLVPGRVLRTCVTKGQCKWVIYNVHNHGISDPDLASVIEVLSADSLLARSHPEVVTVSVLGDFNFCAPSEGRLKIATPECAVSNAVACRAAVRRWQSALSQLVEIQQGSPTHYCAGSHSMTRLDRVYVSIPPYMLTLMSAKCTVTCCPRWSHDRGLSDHAPVACALSPRTVARPDSRPIPAYVFKLPGFVSIHDALVEAACLDSLPTVARWMLHKTILRESARIARDDLLAVSGDLGQARGTTLSSIARAVWTNSTRLARTLISRSALALRHLRVSGNDVTLADPPAFETCICEDRCRSFDERIAREQADLDLKCCASSAPRRRSNRMSALLRLARLWSPFDRRLVVAGVITGFRSDGSPCVVLDPTARIGALSAAWSDTFSAQPSCMATAEEVIARWARPLDFSRVSPPSVEDFKTAASRARSSAPGRDGLPYEAWAAAGDSGASTLHAVCCSLLQGVPMPISFNDGVMVFAPKGEREGDESAVHREAIDTRPLSLKNSDNKLVCGVMNFKCRGPLTRGACPLQRGFVPGRQLLANVVDLDAYGRAHGMASVAGDPAVMAFWDFAAAFPSLAHQWLMLVAAACGLPAGMLLLLESMYAVNLAYGAVGASLRFLFAVWAGVLQGCPWSGFLFAISLDPFLWWISSVLHASDCGVVRACADDIGGSFKRLSALLLVSPVFDAARLAATLRLKPRKCIIVPTGVRLSLHLVEIIRLWLVSHIPEWAAFAVSPSALYLGFWLGPVSDLLQWRGPLVKWSRRVEDVAAAGTSACVTQLRYSSRAFPVLGYVAQLAPPPATASTLERQALHRLLHIPFNAMGAHGVFHLRDAGCRSFPCLTALSLAARYRAARVTVPDWPDLCCMLEREALEHLPMGRSLTRLWWPAVWDSVPFALVLADAAAGFPGASCVHGALTTAFPNLFNRPAPPVALPRGLQAAVNAVVTGALHPEPLALVVRKRASRLVQLPVSEQSVKELLTVLKASRPHVAMCCVKTVTNAWATSHRYHEHVRLGCVFGCGGADDTLSHYLSCPVLWDLVGDSFPPPDSTSPIDRICLRSPTKHRVVQLFCAYHIYHCIKISERLLVDSSDFPRIRSAAAQAGRAAVLLVARGQPD